MDKSTTEETTPNLVPTIFLSELAKAWSSGLELYTRQAEWFRSQFWENGLNLAAENRRLWQQWVDEYRAINAHWHAQTLEMYRQLQAQAVRNS